MSVRLMMPAEGVEGHIVCRDRSGKVIPTPHTIEIDPYFFQQSQVQTIGYVSVMLPDSEKAAHKCILQISGHNGHVRLTTMGDRCTPRYERAAAPAVEAVVRRRLPEKKPAILETEDD